MGLFYNIKDYSPQRLQRKKTEDRGKKKKLDTDLTQSHKGHREKRQEVRLNIDY